MNNKIKNNVKSVQAAVLVNRKYLGAKIIIANISFDYKQISKIAKQLLIAKNEDKAVYSYNLLPEIFSIDIVTDANKIKKFILVFLLSNIPNYELDSQLNISDFLFIPDYKYNNHEFFTIDNVKLIVDSYKSNNIPFFKFKFKLKDSFGITASLLCNQLYDKEMKSEILFFVESKKFKLDNS